jgi:hypothetical protein
MVAAEGRGQLQSIGHNCVAFSLHDFVTKLLRGAVPGIGYPGGERRSQVRRDAMQ